MLALKSWATVAVVAVTLGFSANSCLVEGKKGRVSMVEQQVMVLMKQLDTIDERSRSMLLSQVDVQRNELLGILLKHLGTSPSTNVHAAAIYLIGRHRLAEGTEDLVKRIDFDPGRTPHVGPEPLWEKYPAMEALITIGKPSIKPTLELLASDGSDLRRALAVKVIRYVEGADTALFVLQKAHDSEHDPNRKTMLTDAYGRMVKLISETR